MPVSWTEATKLALQNYSKSNQTIVINRQKFDTQELSNIVSSTSSAGKTPAQTLSRVLQELRDEKFIFFTAKGEYTLNQTTHATQEDLADDVLENAILRNELIFDDVMAGDMIKLTRLRKGADKLRALTLHNYRSRCALCDVSDTKLLVTSHIVPWAQDQTIRGYLDNVICLCTLHDKLFEEGYFSMNDDYELIWKNHLGSHSLEKWKDLCTTPFSAPIAKTPKPQFIARHRQMHKF